MRIVPVNINWQGKKSVDLPQGMQYITVAKFPADKDWPHEAWSVVLQFKTSPKQQGNPSRATAHFLVKNAPEERLNKGKKFELYEGKSLIAQVEIE